MTQAAPKVSYPFTRSYRTSKRRFRTCGCHSNRNDQRIRFPMSCGGIVDFVFALGYERGREIAHWDRTLSCPLPNAHSPQKQSSVQLESIRLWRHCHAGRQSLLGTTPWRYEWNQHSCVVLRPAIRQSATVELDKRLSAPQGKHPMKLQSLFLRETVVDSRNLML